MQLSTLQDAPAVRRSGNVEARELELPGVLLVTTRRFSDARGFFTETYNRRDFVAVGIDHDFVQDNQSLSRPAGTVRGLHFQTPPHAQAKLIRVLRGAILDVVVDLRASSPTFGQHCAVELRGTDDQQFFIPEGFAHGFCTLEPDTEITYKVTDLYAPDCDRGLAWDDPELGIAWPVAPEAALLSDKDRRQPKLRDLPRIFG
ncbi:dTDP-4-dehydrorhamnose 3,5-epimerase [Roseomonas sp. OT10]|uniref:dTDP-4-dehydrorhamnose 3,5-epimerase n=1 Tax=Roseomonas cutis TaxID=2897332 RepID=UPI001E3D87E3|nr:dTDP-4-dehydrorhamnose 3,5-epimerase [Roseomonas sp. OT10]UFN50700.1 dTDP-4-dehydrorhamnose 3,5-epimerase [Roseomonas sp. OT10]